MTKISLRIGLSNGRAVFEISDDGCGIDRDRLDQLFKGFYSNPDMASDTQRRNAGIGLSVCATIIKAHGGSIYAENAEGGGAVFRFDLEACESCENYNNNEEET